MRRVPFFQLSCALCVALFLCSRPAAAQTGDVITIHAPEAQRYEIAFDEIELSPSRGEWKGGQELRAVEGARLSARQPQGAVFHATVARSREAVAFLARSLENANPDSRANLVLYVAGQRHMPSTRRILTREVGVMLRDDADARTFLDEQQRYAPRAVAGLPNAFVLTAQDPLDAVDLADALRVKPDIAHAYPVLRQQRFLR